MYDRTVNRRSTFRRWVLPLVILAVAGGLAWWGSRREAGRAVAIEASLREIAADPSRASGAASALPGLREALTVLSRGGDVDALEIEIRPGDLDSGPGGASHVAVLTAGDGTALTLRLVHRGTTPLGTADVEIIGFVR